MARYNTKAERNALLIADRQDGKTYKQLATRYGIDAEQCRKICVEAGLPTVWRGVRSAPSPQAVTAMKVVTQSHEAKRLSRSLTIRERAEALRVRLQQEIAAIDIGGRVMKPKELAKYREEIRARYGARQFDVMEA